LAAAACIIIGIPKKKKNASFLAMKTIRIIVFGLMGLAVLAAASAVYGHYAKKYDAIAKMPLLPAKPLSEFPMALGDWQGRDVPISDTVLKVAGNDDYLSRFYVNPKIRAGSAIYVGYTSEPRRMLGHRPQVCYVGSGWIHDYTRPHSVSTAAGNTIEVLIHRFYKTGLQYEEVFVLNYYIVNGKLTTDHNSFDGLHWRRPKQSGGRLQYVAQVQISSASEQSVRLLGAQAADLIMSFMP